MYLSEDVDGGGLYRFTPTVYPDLSAGLLEIACTGVGNSVVWKTVPIRTPAAGGTPTRNQVADSIKFRRGEGIWFDSGFVYLATTTDETIHVYDTTAQTLGIVYRAARRAGHAAAQGVDNVLVTKSGDLMVAEDSYTNDPDAMDVCLITQDNEVSRFLKMTGDDHFLPGQSEVVSIAFSPDGTRMYVGSQRYNGHGPAVRDHAVRSARTRPTIYQDIPEPATPTPTATPVATASPRAHAHAHTAAGQADARRPDRPRRHEAAVGDELHPQRPRDRVHARQGGLGPGARHGQDREPHEDARRRSRAARSRAGRCCALKASKSGAKLLQGPAAGREGDGRDPHHHAGRAGPHVQADGHRATVGGCA